MDHYSAPKWCDFRTNMMRYSIVCFTSILSILRHMLANVMLKKDLQA